MAEDNKITNKELLKKEANLLKKEENLLKKQEAIVSSQKNRNKADTDKQKLLQKQEELLIKKQQLFNEDKKQNRKSVSQTEVLKKLIETLKKQNSEKGTMKSKVNANTKEKVKMGEGVADILTKIYGLLKKRDEDERQDKEIEKDFEKQKENDSEKGKSSKSSTASRVSKSNNAGFSWEDVLLGVGLFLLDQFGKPLLEGIQGILGVLGDIKNFVGKIIDYFGIGDRKVIPPVVIPKKPTLLDKNGKEKIKGAGGNRGTGAEGGKVQLRETSGMQYEKLSIEDKTKLAERGIYQDESPTGPNSGRLYKRSSSRGMQGEKVYLSEAQSRLAMSKVPGGAMMAKSKAEYDKIMKKFNDAMTRLSDLWKRIVSTIKGFGGKIPDSISQMSKSAWNSIKLFAKKWGGRGILAVNVGIIAWNMWSMLSTSFQQWHTNQISGNEFLGRIGLAVEEISLILAEGVLGTAVGAAVGGTAGFAVAGPAGAAVGGFGGGLLGGYTAVDLMETKGINESILKATGKLAGLSDQEIMKNMYAMGIDSSPFNFDTYYDAIKKHESSNNYSADNKVGFVGAYQMGSSALQDAGFLRKDIKIEKGVNDKGPNAAVYNPNAWASGWSLEKFLANKDAQDEAYKKYTKSNYDMLVKNKVITPEMGGTDVAERLGYAQESGASGAISHYTKDKDYVDFRSGKTASSISEDIGAYYQSSSLASAQTTPKTDPNKLSDINSMMNPTIIHNTTNNNNTVAQTPSNNNSSGGNQASPRSSESTLQRALWNSMFPNAIH